MEAEINRLEQLNRSLQDAVASRSTDARLSSATADLLEHRHARVTWDRFMPSAAPGVVPTFAVYSIHQKMMHMMHNMSLRLFPTDRCTTSSFAYMPSCGASVHVSESSFISLLFRQLCISFGNAQMAREELRQLMLSIFLWRRAQIIDSAAASTSNKQAVAGVRAIDRRMLDALACLLGMEKSLRFLLDGGGGDHEKGARRSTVISKADIKLKKLLTDSALPVSLREFIFEDIILRIFAAAKVLLSCVCVSVYLRLCA